MDDTAARHAPLAACPNCDTPLDTGAAAPRYCPHCGQEAVLHPPSVTEFAHEFVGHYIALEGALWRTLRLLVMRPGRLTVEYLGGRRRQYVLPLRLYLTASFLFFLALKLPGWFEGAAHEAPGAHAVAAAASVPAAASATVADDDDDAVLLSIHGAQAASQAEARRIVHENEAACAASAPQAPGCGWAERTFTRASARWLDDPSRAQSAFVAHALGIAPYAVFLMLPVYAAFVALAYRGRRMLFGEHLVFGMHLHAFVFLAATLALVLPGFLVSLLVLLVVAYATAALRVVYPAGWGATIARGLLVSVLYGTSLAVVTAALGVWLFIH